MYRILHIISSFMCSMPKRRVDMKFSRGGKYDETTKAKKKNVIRNRINIILFWTYIVEFLLGYSSVSKYE